MTMKNGNPMLKHAIFQAILERRMVAIVRAGTPDAALQLSLIHI